MHFHCALYVSSSNFQKLTFDFLVFMTFCLSVHYSYPYLLCFAKLQFVTETSYLWKKLCSDVLKIDISESYPVS